MKKVILTLCMTLCCFFGNFKEAKAEEYYYQEVIEIVDQSYTRATSTKTAKKTGTFTNSSGAKLWSVTVTGTFTYNGSTSTCTSSSVTAETFNTNWKIASKSASKSGNKASATATAKCYLAGNLISTGTKTVTLTCSATGSLS